MKCIVRGVSWASSDRGVSWVSSDRGVSWILSGGECHASTGCHGVSYP